MREVESKYAWIVLAGSAIVNFLTIGFCFGTVGVFTSEYNNVFGIDTASSSWVGSILTGTILLSGELLACLVDGSLYSFQVGTSATHELEIVYL